MIANVRTQLARIFFGVCRGGTTATFAACANHSQVFGVLHPMKNGMKTGTETDLFYKNDFGTKPFRVAKESIGYASTDLCKMDLFPSHISKQTFIGMRPIALFREPTAVWNSWAKNGWGSMKLFEIAYIHLMNQAMKAVNDLLQATLERLVSIWL